MSLAVFSDWRLEEAPEMYGWFHLSFFALTIIISILFAVFGKNDSKKKIDKVVFSIGLFLLIIEVYKQWLYTATSSSGYQWYAFPFQFCSVPIYVCLISPWLKNSKVKQACYYFLGIYALLAGLSVMLYPVSVFTTTLTISIHTMLWHGTMIVIGVYMVVTQKIGVSVKQWLKQHGQAACVWLFFVLFALFLDILFHYTLWNLVGQPTFNMFFISPFDTTSLVILCDIQNSSGWLVMFICYLVAFTLGSSIVWWAIRGIRALAGLFKKKAIN